MARTKAIERAPMEKPTYTYRSTPLGIKYLLMNTAISIRSNRPFIIIDNGHNRQFESVRRY